MTDKSGDWVEETPDYDNPKSPVVDQLKFTFEEDWTVEDDDYSYEVETYSDDESTQEKNTPKTPNTPATTKISPLKKQISINNRYVRRKSGCAGVNPPVIGLLGSSPPKHQSAKHQPYNAQNNIQTSGMHAKQKYVKPENTVQVQYAVKEEESEFSETDMEKEMAIFMNENSKINEMAEVNESLNRIQKHNENSKVTHSSKVTNNSTVTNKSTQNSTTSKPAINRQRSVPSLSRQNSTRNIQQMFIDYCNKKVPVQDLVNEVATRTLANPDVARQLGLTIGVIVKDEQIRKTPTLLPILLKKVQELYSTLKTTFNTMTLPEILGTVALLCACFEHLTTADGTPLMKPLVTPILKSLEILLDYNPETQNQKELQLIQEQCASNLLHHLRLLGAKFEGIQVEKTAFLFDRIRMSAVSKFCSRGFMLSLLELVELRASGWKLGPEVFNFYVVQKTTKFEN